MNLPHNLLLSSSETPLKSFKSIVVKRELEGGWFQWSTLSLPASISIQSGINTPRYATLKGIMMVKNKPVDKFNPEFIENLNLSTKVLLKSMYVPNKSKETKYIDGTPDEISGKLVEVLKNEIRVMG